jgi:hypothetical protein
VTDAFVASTHRQSSGGHREFSATDALVFLRIEDHHTIFARVEDIAIEQPDPITNLPEYSVETEIFNASTKHFVR